MNGKNNSHIKEFKMFVLLVVLITTFIYLLFCNKYISVYYDDRQNNRVVAAKTQYEKIKQPNYDKLEFISKEQFFKYQIATLNNKINYYESVSCILAEENRVDSAQIEIVCDMIHKNNDEEISGLVNVTAHIVLKNNGKSGLCNVKPKLRILMREGIYNDKLNDKFKLIDMKFDTDIEGYTLPEIDNSSSNLNSDMGYVRTDDWKSFAFRVYIESNSEISYTCVFRTPKEYADDENLVIGNDDSHASRRWDGEKEVTYDTGGYRIYINRQ